MSDDRKKGFLGRRAGYVGRRISASNGFGVGRKSIARSAAMLRDGLPEKRLTLDDDRKAYRGAFDDGGREAFRKAVAEAELSGGDIDAIAAEHARAARIFVVYFLVGVCASIALIVLAGELVVMLGGLVMLVFSFTFMAASFMHDFLGWQLRARRFGGLRDYLFDR